jgi:hypothetical protein
MASSLMVLLELKEKETRRKNQDQEREESWMKQGEVLLQNREETENKEMKKWKRK